MKIRIRIQGFLVFFSLALPIFLSKFLFPVWKDEAVDEILDAIGVGIILFGMLIRISARGQKADFSSDGGSLITNGLYSFLRNPMYFGTFLIGSGVALVLFEWWALVVFMIVFLLIYIPQIIKEENRLLKLFGAEYKDYCRNTSRFFPNIVYVFKTDVYEYLYFKWPWVKKELLSLLGIIFAIIAIETWEDVRVFGYAEYKKESLELVAIVLSFVIVSAFLYKKEKR
jgi:protein-S-isoprenylcysteine O-methyltransferase Ste14